MLAKTSSFASLQKIILGLGADYMSKHINLLLYNYLCYRLGNISSDVSS